MASWSYRAGTSGTVTVPGGFRVRGFGCYSIGGGTVRINGGEECPVLAGVPVNVNPDESLGAPTAGSTEPVVIVFDGTDMFFVELVVR